MDACDASGEAHRETLTVFTLMREAGVEADAAAYKLAISAHAKRKQWKDAKKLCDEMKEKAIPPDAATYAALLRHGALQQPPISAEIKEWMAEIAAGGSGSGSGSGSSSGSRSREVQTLCSSSLQVRRRN
jgi:pentatricopeptide repeat protein